MKQNRKMNDLIRRALALCTIAVLVMTAAIGISAVDVTPEDTFEISAQPMSMEILSQPKKTVYDVGEAFSAEGLTLNIKYNNGTSETIKADASMCTGFDSSTVGTQMISVTYKGLGASFKVTVREIKSVSIASTPTKTVYYVGEDLDLDGLKLKVSYSAGEADIIEAGYTLVGETKLDAAGTRTVSVSYSGYTTSFIVTVKKVEALSATLTSLPVKTEYMVGDEFDGTGAAFTVTYTDGSTKTFTDGITFTGFSSTAKGERTITATYGEFTDKFTVNIKYAAHVHVAGGDREIIKEASCFETGKAVRYCKICGEVAESATLKKLSHTYGEWVTLSEATVDADGERNCTCTVCGAVQMLTLPRLSSVITDGKNGSVSADGGYLFPTLSVLRIENISASITSTQLKPLEDTAKKNDRSVAAVFNVYFIDENGKSFTPDADLTYQLVLPAGDLREFSNLKVVYGTKIADATYSGGFISFTVKGVSGVFAIAGVKSTTPTTTTAPVTTTTPEPITTAPAPITDPPAGTIDPGVVTTPTDPTVTTSPITTTDPVVTPGPGEDTRPADPAVTTEAGGDNEGGLGGAIKTIIIVIVVIVVIGALFELLYIYLKNKLML